MKNPIIFLGPRLCKKCNREAIEIYDYFGNPLGYAQVLDKKEMGLESGLDGKAVYEMKCRGCNTKYNIIWEDGFPFPDLRETTLSQQFINLFIEGV